MFDHSRRIGGHIKMTLETTLLLAGELSHHEAPLLDVDGTVFLQLAIFIVAYFFLSRWLFVPYLKLKDLRDKNTNLRLEQVVSLEEEVERLGKEYQLRLEEYRKEIEIERREIYSKRMNEVQEKVDQVKQATQAQVSAARYEMQEEMEKARQELMKITPLIGQQIADNVVGKGR